MKRNSYLLELAKKWYYRSKIKNIPGVELDDVYQELYLLWLEQGKPGQFDESKLCTHYFAIARKLGYWQGCDRSSDSDADCDGDSDDGEYQHQQQEFSGYAYGEIDQQSLYARYADEIELIEDELDRITHLNAGAIKGLLGVKQSFAFEARERYIQVIAQRCKDKINRAAKRRKANQGA